VLREHAALEDQSLSVGDFARTALRIFFTLGPALRARQSGQLARQGELGYQIVWMHQGDKR
jgi:hypothetical protein